LSLPRRIWKALCRRLRHARILLTARSGSRRNLQQRRGGNLLVLCYGNIYRSPFVANQLRRQLPAGQFAVRSAGFHHRVDRSCASDYIPLAAEFGASLAEHRSRRVVAEDLQWADLIVIMDRKNWDALQDLGVPVANKTVWISSALDGAWPEIADPYGMDEAGVRRILGQLQRSSEALARALQPGGAQRV